MKVLKSSRISPFGGLNFVLEEFDKLNIGDILSNELPALPKQSKYDWRDLLYSYWSVIFCGGSCAEDLNENLKTSLSNIPHLKIPSPDRVLARMKQIAVQPNIYNTPRGNSDHEFCHNDLINRLNIRVLKAIPSFKTKGATLDYDNSFIFSNKADANMTYMKEYGYAPGVGIIGNKVAYIENRNGNSDAQTLQQDTLRRMFELLGSENIQIDNFRADSASYQFSTLLEISKNVKRFYIKARMTQTTSRTIAQIDNWKQIKKGNEIVYRGDTSFIPFTSNKHRHGQKHPLIPYRLVVTKEKRRDGQINLFTNEAYAYSAIITNDTEMANHQVVNFYNQRGSIEKEFDILKNDFCWDNMPFSKLSQNTVYLGIMAICRNLYDHIIVTFSRKFTGLRTTDRLKKLVFRFICIPAKWVKTARQWKLKVYGQIAYKT